ncbi:excalibur calcium-binding domain-containing protein [Arthrobacter sp. PM3]|uniref:excalibur calcium-binding domain-containing protein n=1 Tax=Arthrobacter sp. PM3 TaxID=2017685 RepID=UPI0021C411F8|nr:excalibur calcium-binding domain-containing protein [Arthrobacter sp. PM3]
MRLKKLIIASLAGTAVVLSATAVPASAAPAPKSYKNCTELNKVYPHGVGRAGARDKTSGKPVTTFRVDNTLYSYNDGAGPRHWGEHDLDRDNDGIACEKR